MTPPPIRRTVRRRLDRARWLLAPLTLVPAMGLTGCLSLTIRTHQVPRTVRATGVMDATLEQLNEKLAADYAQIQSMNLSVDIQASTGGGHQGEVKEIPAFSGYILMRKPSDLRVLILLPVVRSLALDMVSDGANFKLLIPPKNKAIVGSDQLTTPSTNGLENLRPGIVREALLVPAVQPDEFVNLTENVRVLPPAPGKKEATEEPDYDLTVSRARSGNVLETVRVIHIGRVTLRPYEQDIYDHAGRLVTVVTYDKYQKFGEITFPASILITRPIDEYALKIDISKATFNQKLDDEQFVLKIPENVPVTKM